MTPETPQNDDHETPPSYTLKIRQGCEGGGKGALIQTDKSGTLSTNNDQYLFQPVTDGNILDDQGGQQITVREDGKAPTLRAETHGNLPCVMQAKAYSVENHPNDSRVKIDEEGKVQALTGRMGTGGGNVPMVLEEKPLVCIEGNGSRPSLGIDRAAFNQGENAKFDFTISEEQSSTLVARGPNAVCYWDGGQTAGTLTANNAGGNQRMPDKDNFNCIIEETPEPQYIVRRLTPTECCRLQGFPDGWGEIDPKEDFTDEEYKFWYEVRSTHAAINGKKQQAYTKKQMLTWYNKLHTDSAEYKMWGNGIALPDTIYVMEGIAEALKKQEADDHAENDCEAAGESCEKREIP